MHITALDDSDADDGGFNLEGSINISSALFSNALQVWCFAQDRQNVTIQEAAMTFNTTQDVIRQAVNHHCWMLEGNGGVIEHDGE